MAKGVLSKGLGPAVALSVSWVAHARSDSSSTYLGSRDAVEAHTHQDTGDGHLVITEFNTIKILHTERVRSDQSVET